MSSKFKGILDAARGRDPELVALTAEEIAEEKAPAPKATGRPATGKRSSDQHTQVTAYVKTATHRAVKIALLQDGKGQEFSELVEQLLADWLKSRT